MIQRPFSSRGDSIAGCVPRPPSPPTPHIRQRQQTWFGNEQWEQNTNVLHRKKTIGTSWHGSGHGPASPEKEDGLTSGPRRAGTTPPWISFSHATASCARWASWGRREWGQAEPDNEGTGGSYIYGAALEGRGREGARVEGEGEHGNTITATKREQGTE